MSLPSRDLLVPVYTVGVIGAFMQIAGGYWDVSWHILRIVETFFTPPHSILYTGVALALLAGISGLFLRLRTFRGEEPQKRLLTGLRVALLGCAFQLVAGPFDFWWHSSFGFDPVLFTPPHILLIVGIILNSFGMAVGAVRLLQAYRAGLSLGRFFVSSKWLQLLSLVALTSLWLGLNILVYLITDVNGLAYTFRLGKSFVNESGPFALAAASTMLSATGTILFFSAKRIFAWRGAVMAIALLSTAVSATTNLGFRALVLGARDYGPAVASFIPLYLSFLIPVFLFDLLVKDSSRKLPILLASALIGPFASFLDGWNVFTLWRLYNPLIPILLVPMLAAGVIAGLSSVSFVNSLLLQPRVLGAHAPWKNISDH